MRIQRRSLQAEGAARTREAGGDRHAGGGWGGQGGQRSKRREVEKGEVQDMRRGQQIIEQKIITSVSQDCWKVEMQWHVKSSCCRNWPHLRVKVLSSGSRPTTYWWGEVGQILPLLYLEWEGLTRVSPRCSNSLNCHTDKPFHLLNMYCVPGTVPSEREVYRRRIWGQGHSSGKWHSWDLDPGSLSWVHTKLLTIALHVLFGVWVLCLIEILIPALYHCKILYLGRMWRAE